MSNERPVYLVQLDPEVLKSLRKLSRDTVGRLQRAIDDLSLNPRPHGYKTLKGRHNHYRVRVGKWRIVYTIHDDKLMVLVVDVDLRSDVYRKF